MNINNLHIPTVINYQCTGCGTCCSGWAVPLTPEDHERIADVNWWQLNPLYQGQKLFRQLKKFEQLNTPYSHKIISDDGTCPFLVDKLCYIHSQKGAEFKPSICQLFPYCFTDTPSGTYATVSFVSIGALHNAGKPLAEQTTVLEQKLAEFRRLFPDYKPDWSKIVLSAQQPISWDEYLKHEEELFSRLNEQSLSLTERLQNCCDYLAAQVEARSQVRSDASTRGLSLNKLDKHLLSTFHKMYLPSKPQRSSEKDFHTYRFWFGTIFNTSTVFEVNNQYYAIDQLREMPFPENKEIDAMLYRYVFSHIFGKKYFGAGFGGLSLVTGFHHLIMIVTLARLHARGLALSRQASSPDLSDMTFTLRKLETQLGETKLGPSAASSLELLLQYSSRAQRFLANS